MVKEAIIALQATLILQYILKKKKKLMNVDLLEIQNVTKFEEKKIFKKCNISIVLNVILNFKKQLKRKRRKEPNCRCNYRIKL